MKTLKRRRREGKTDYKARLKLLESSIPRVVIRKTNRYIMVQYVESREAQDFVKLGVSSKELLKYGWEQKRSLKSIPACYLTGVLLGKKIKGSEENAEAILDIGLQRDIKKGRIYAVLKGIVDAGIKMKSKDEVFPDEKRRKGEHLKNKINFEEIRRKIEEK